jgi:hypothetical protein
MDRRVKPGMSRKSAESGQTGAIERSIARQTRDAPKLLFTTRDRAPGTPKAGASIANRN